jgi:hypothetical protein
VNPQACVTKPKKKKLFPCHFPLTWRTEPISNLPEPFDPIF